MELDWSLPLCNPNHRQRIGFDNNRNIQFIKVCYRAGEITEFFRSSYGCKHNRCQFTERSGYWCVRTDRWRTGASCNLLYDFCRNCGVKRLSMRKWFAYQSWKRNQKIFRNSSKIIRERFRGTPGSSRNSQLPSITKELLNL